MTFYGRRVLRVDDFSWKLLNRVTSSALKNARPWNVTHFSSESRRVVLRSAQRAAAATAVRGSSCGQRGRGTPSMLLCPCINIQWSIVVIVTTRGIHKRTNRRKSTKSRRRQWRPPSYLPPKRLDFFFHTHTLSLPTTTIGGDGGTGTKDFAGAISNNPFTLHRRLLSIYGQLWQLLGVCTTAGRIWDPTMVVQNVHDCR